ncbi:YdcF family protein [Vibrio coralliilyticus]|uniref:YdcF family protein n=1 Tax=Vibrio coralliilyticus TaxID=190893 RepID=UPI00155F75FB|nr:YdcF family protein [Vibrio coralliilyticus]NRF30648.1 YdcF family protein [Vibrio coralliilyticus]NRF54226.1 YdcF family protein [Vibrio coralliilyticus]NRG05896.1 YdcF family protein [Vibrio coralliilyticus]
MNIRNVVIVLGKRLVGNALTAEGKSRVEALPKLLSSCDLNETALLFCGGVTPGQTISEAMAMRDYFKQLPSAQMCHDLNIILESDSQNTVQNIHNAALKLKQLGLEDQRVDVTLVSNDYHLKRIFEIQSLMDEQGLLRTLKQHCANSGLNLHIDQDIDQHCSVMYPHQGLYAQAFLLVDELTTYRVYLEGVVNRAFDRPLDDVRCLPETLALRALSLLEVLNLPVEIQDKLQSMKEVVLTTTSKVDCHAIESQLTYFHQTLTWLNRQLDPESQPNFSVNELSS